jgi:hypothetical protein
MGEIDPALADRSPPECVRELIRRVLDDWDTEAGRLWPSLMVRDGLAHDPVIAKAIEDDLEQMAALFGRWIDSGQVPAGLGSPFDLAYALLAPIGEARMFWMHADASPETRAMARKRATRHTEWFIRRVFCRTEPHR